MKINISINEELINQKASNPQHTPMFINFEHESTFYPASDWIDNPSVILGWWTYSVEDLLSGGEGQGFSFMEGPFFLKGSVDGNDLILSSEDGAVFWKIRVNELVAELIAALNRASRIFYEMGLIPISRSLNEDVSRLKLKLNPARG